MAVDFVKFAVDGIKILDELRSTNSDPKNVSSNSAKPIESRINTFYRAIGLPAFYDDETIQDKDYNNGNLFESSSNNTTKSYLNDAIERDVRFSLELDIDVQTSFLDNSTENILGSVKGPRDTGVRKKGGLFPVVVNGNVKIYPQDRRVAGAFYEKDFSVNEGTVKYRRPLIETIILLRLRGQGLVDATDRENLRQDFSSIVGEDFFDGSAENILTAQILSSLLNALIEPDGIVKLVEATTKKLSRIRKQKRETFKDSKEAIVPAEQQITRESDGQGQLERLKKDRELLKAKNEVRITLLEYDDTISSDATKNMKEALFSQMVLNALLSDSSDINKSIKECENNENNIDREQKNLNKTMDLLLGSYSGISGVDILIVILALFTINIEDLLGLLNENAIDRLTSLKKKGNTNFSLTKNTVVNSIQALEDKIKELFDIFVERVNIVKLQDKNTRNEG